MCHIVLQRDCLSGYMTVPCVHTAHCPMTANFITQKLGCSSAALLFHLEKLVSVQSPIRMIPPHMPQCNMLSLSLLPHLLLSLSIWDLLYKTKTPAVSGTWGHTSREDVLPEHDIHIHLLWGEKRHKMHSGKLMSWIFCGHLTAINH